MKIDSLLLGISGFLVLQVAHSDETLRLRGKTLHNKNADSTLESSSSSSSRQQQQPTDDPAQRILMEDVSTGLIDFCSKPELNWCHPNAMCIPNPASFLRYECRCNEEDGLTGDGFTDCQEYNECENAYPCALPEQGGTCENRDRSAVFFPKYKCGCLAGWIDGPVVNEHGPTTCIRTNECNTGTHNCDANAMCLDKVDGYDCQCDAGFIGDGFSCLMTTEFAIARAADMGLRFSKIRYSVPQPPEAVLPLTATSYPLTNETVEWLKVSDAHSVTVPGECEECDIPLRELINKIGGLPTHPSSDPDSPFWAELEHVVDVQYQRLANVNPNDIMPLPTLWKNMTIAQVAEAVHDEYPGSHHVEYLKSMNSGGTNAIGFKINNDVIPYTCRVEFIREVVMIADLLTWAIARVGPLNFGVKWTGGRLRPEEAAQKILTDTMPAGPSATLISKIKNLPSWDGARAESFTAYPEGSPRHPSWPAMHSAGSAASLWMPVVMDLTDAEWCQVKLTDYAVSYARTVAGVHYVTDNLAGLALGQEIVARRLPQHLHDKYGTDMAAVEARIASVRFDWTTFLESDCAKGNIV